MKTVSILLLGLLLLSSCQRSDPPFIPRDQFVQSYADLMEVSALAQQARLDTTAAAHAVDSVLSKENVTREQMMASVRWYSRDVHNWNGILEDVSKELDRRRARR